ncbi:MAG: tetratricopeptide repeat protein [Gammaproteobacteria bacterium]
MSLIYQALRQMEQRDAAAAPARPAPAPVRPAAPRASAARPHPWLWGAAAVLLTGLGAGLWQGSVSKSPVGLPEATASRVAPPVAKPAEPDVAAVVPAPEPALPRAQTPLPMSRAPLAPIPERSSSRFPVRQDAAVPVSIATPQAVVARPASPSPSSDPAPVEKVIATAESVPQQAAVATPAATVPDKEIVALPVESAPVEDMRALFDRFNRALSAQDRGQARQHLDAIQARLPASSVARWRAEAWFAYQTDDLQRARDVYRGLLDKLPGDENATLSLVAIEQRLDKPGAARAVLEAALRHSPNSAPLRAALDRLQQSEAGR